MTQRKPTSEPPGESFADDLIGDDPEPVGGWRQFDENGKRIPSGPLPRREPPSQSLEPPEAPPDSEPEFEPEGQSLADELIGSDPEPIGGWRNFDRNGNRIPSQPRRQAEPRKGMTWQEYASALPELPAGATLEQWRAAVAEAKALLEQVDEPDRQMAARVLGDSLIQSGVFKGYV